MGSNPASPTPRFESEGQSAFRFRATGSVYSRRLRRRVAFSPAFSPLVLRCAPSAPVELVARPQRLARARYGASALRAESSNPAFSPLVLRRAPSAPVELVARTRSRLRSRQSRSAASKLAPPALARPRSHPRVLRFQVSQINCDSKRVIAHPAFSPIAFGCKQACAARSGPPALARPLSFRISLISVYSVCLMRSNFLPFCRPSISEEDIAAIGDVLRSGWITTGPRVTELEQMIADRTGAKEAIAATSGTALMHLTLQAMGIGPGDEVIGPSMTWVSTPNMVEMRGARNIFVDVDRNTLLVSADAIEAAITPRTRLVIPVHYAGAPVDIDAIRAICAKRGVPILEDAAHAIGTQYKGREIGGGDPAIFSLHPIKNITSGEGGVLTTNDTDLANRVRRLRFHGLAVDANDRRQQGRSPQAEVQEPGYKQNMADMNAVLAVRQMPRLDWFIERREAITQFYRSRLAEVDGILPMTDPTWSHRHARHLFVVRVDEKVCGMDRNTFMDGLKARNIGTGIHFLASHGQKWYRENRPEWMGKLPNTEWNSTRICTIPCFPDMTDADANDVIDAIKETLAGARATVSGGIR